MIAVKPTSKLVFDLKMLQVDYSEPKKEALRKEIAKKYNVPLKNVEINFVPITVDDNGDDISVTADIINNVQDPAFQLELFKDYLKLKEINDVDFEDIKEIDTKVNAFVDFDSYSKYKKYKFKYVKWDNYLSYGKGNYFDFTKLHGLVLLNGEPENQTGKTTFAIDLLRFALFGKAQKSPNLESVFNIYHPEETEVMVEAGLEIEGCDYVIRRTVTRPPLEKRTAKSKPKQKVEYFKVVNGVYDEIENCEGESTSDTNNIIKESVGSVDDYNLVISATSKTLADLLEMGQTDKGRLFSRWLGLLTIEKKEEIAKELWKKNINPALLSNTYNKKTIDGEIKDFKTLITDAEENMKGENDKLLKSSVRIAELNEEKVKVISDKKEIKDITGYNVETLENTLKMKKDDLSIKAGQWKQNDAEYQKIKDVTFDADELTELMGQIKVKNDDIVKIGNDNVEIKTKIGLLKKDNERIKELIDKKVCPTCGHPIELAEQNGFIEKNNASINELIAIGVENKSKMDALKLEVEEMGKKQAEMEKNRETVHAKNGMELKAAALRANIEQLRLEIADIQRKQKEIEDNKENLRHNNEIELKVRTLDETIKVENSIKDVCVRNCEAYRKDIENYGKEIEKRKTLVDKLAEEEKIIRNWSIYQQLVGKNGITKIVLKRALPIINNEIARILDGLCDFEVKLSVSDDGKVCMDLVRDGIPLDLGTGASGFESVMASLAIRHALASLASISRPNLLCLDEVLDGVAVSNYENVRKLYERIMDNHDFILHITHNEMLFDWHTQNVKIIKDMDKNVSTIKLI